MSITAHTISKLEDGTITLTNSVLACNKFFGSHTAEKILEEIQRQENKWDVKFNSIVSDNAPNVIKAMALGGYKGIRCMAHSLNLVVQNLQH